MTVELDEVSIAIGGARILDRVSLRVGEGERVAIVGPNGTGKSTLIDVVLGLRAPDRGRVRVLGRAPPSRDFGFVPQDPGASLLPWRTARDNVLLPLLVRGMGTGEAARALDAAWCAIDPARELELDARPDALSGGQRQLVALLRALVGEPPLLVLDEPFSALEAPLRARLREVIVRRGVAVLIATHDIDDVRELATRTERLSGRPARIVPVALVGATVG